MNAMGGQGKQITDQRGLSWIKPQMMYQVLSSIALSHENKDAHPPSQLELLKLFPDSRMASEEETIESNCLPFANDSRSVSGISSGKQSVADLIICYNGAVKVYHVSADRAQAVMKFADKNCSRERETLKPSRRENEKRREVGLGMAKKLCLQRFLQKRKGRLGSVAPYTSISTGRKWTEEYGDGYEQISLSLSLPSQRSG